MENPRKRSSQAAAEDMLVEQPAQKPSSPSKRQRTSSQHQQIDEAIIQRFKQPEHLLGPQICSLCERNITKSVKILCAECGSSPSEELFMCLECLRLGKPSEDYPNHLANHAYYVFDNLDFPLLTKDWSALQEIRLVQGIMKCGLGNWPDISEQYLRGTKSSKQCEEHYFSVLMKQTEKINYQSALMQRADSQAHSTKELDHKLDSKRLDQVQDMINEYKSMKDEEREQEQQEFLVSAANMHPPQMQGYMEPSAAANPKIVSAPKQNSKQMSSQTNNLAKQHSQSAQNQGARECHEVLGYLPKRGDFEQEYDMDAELLLADMEFFEDDTPENIELKNSVIELYNGRLDERIRRKKFVIDRGLLNLKQVQKFERKRSKEDREIINKMKIFARFNSAEEHTDLVHSILKERLLRETIQQLKFFKSKGLSNMDQIERFIEAQKLKNKSQGNNYEKNYGTSLGRGAAGTAKLQSMEDALDLVKNKEGAMGAFTNRKKGQAVANNQFAKGSHPHLEADEKWNSLSKKEKAFCAELNMKPTSYCTLKRQIQFEVAKNRKVSQKFLETLQTKNKNVPVATKAQIPAIFEFMVNANIISPF